VTLFDLEPLIVKDTHAIAFSSVPSVSALERDFPAAVLSRIGEHESWRKEVHRPATSTHKWWAKRLGSVFRGVMTAAVTENCADALEAYRSATRLEGLTAFDPFSGSGTTIVEALKLGANVIGWDINPVATLVQRQAVQAWDISELERAYKLVEERCRNEIDRLHRTESGETVLYYFWLLWQPAQTAE
jgi:putative DNA methylase